jgi:hypothetical protein
MDPVTRQILMIEIDGPDAETAARRLEAAIPDAKAWGEVDPCEAALLVMKRQPVIASACFVGWAAA